MYSVSHLLRPFILRALALLACWGIPLSIPPAIPLSAQSLNTTSLNTTSLNTTPAADDTPDLDRAQTMLAAQQAVFIANRGQITDSDGTIRHDVRYVAGLGAMTVYFMTDRICYVLSDPEAIRQMKTHRPEGGRAEGGRAEGGRAEGGRAEGGRADGGKDRGEQPADLHVFRFDMKLLGTRSDVEVRGEGQAAGVYTYYTGTQPALQTGAFRTVVYDNIYDGVDLVYSISDKGLKYDFIVEPGADHRAIRWQYEGADGVALSGEGTLQIGTPLGMIEEDIPLTYEIDGDGKRAALPNARFVLEGTECRFDLQRAHPERRLVIDPVIVWATYYGGSAGITSTTDECTAVAVDSDDNVIAAGWTGTNTFPVYMGWQSLSGSGNDAFVVKFNSAGIRQWATYYGGNNDDRAYGVAIGSNDSIYVVGLTNSANFPVAGAFQWGNAGGYDAFIVHFSPSGWRNWASYCGGSSDDFGIDVAISDANVPAFTGTTYSLDFPLAQPLINQLNQTGAGPNCDAFVVTAYKTAQYFGSYFGGDGDDRGLGIIMDPLNYVTFTGYTTPFPGISYPLAGAWQNTYGGGGSDAYLTKINVPVTAAGAAFWSWSTYFGSSGDDVAEDIAMIRPGYTCAVTGYSTSQSIGPTCVQNTTTASFDAIAYVFDYNNGVPISGRFFGGTLNDYAMDIAAIGSTVEEMVITGYGESTDLPLREAFQHSVGATDVFVARLDHAACQIDWSTYYGTTGNEYAYGVCSDGMERTIVVGRADINGLLLRDGFAMTSSTPDGFIAVFDESMGRFPTFMGGSGNEHAEDLDVDYSGNVYLTGWTTSSDLPVTTGAHKTSRSGAQDAFVAKFDAGGNREWITYYGGKYSETGTGIAVDGDNVYVVGYTNSSNNIATPGTWISTAPSSVGDDGFLVKFNSAGVRQWGTYVGGNEDDYVMDVAVDNSGDIVVTGYTRTDFPSTVFASAGAPQLSYGGGVFDAFVSKFNSSGGRIWSTYAGGDGDDRGYGICIEGSNRIIMVGGTDDGSDYPQYGAVSYVGTGWDAIVSKYYDDGSSPWSLVYGGDEQDTAFAVDAQTSGLYGRIYVAGTTENKSLTPSFPTYPTAYGFTNSNDMFVVRFDSLGTRWRARVVDDNNDDEHADAVVAHGDGVIVAGQTASTNLEQTGILPATAIQTSLSGTTDALLLALDQYLVYTDGTHFGGTGDEAGTGVAVDYRNRVVLGGWSSSSAFGAPYDTYWSFQPGNNGGDDAFISRFTLDMTSLAKGGDDTSPASGMVADAYRCYPNPTTGRLALEGEVQPGAPLVITVTDVLGATVLSFEERPSGARYSRSIDVSGLASGTYLLTVRSGARRAVVMMFMKQ